MGRKYLFLIFVTLLCPVIATGQEIETSPDQFETPSTVPKGRFQMENRFQYQDDGRDERSYTIPSANWKYGLNDNVEINMTTDFVNNKTADSIANGLEPVLIGIKVNLLKENGWIPDAAITTQLRIPKLGHTELQTDYLAPRLILHFKHTITEKISLGYNIGTQWDGIKPAPTYLYTISPKFQLSKKFECYIEFFGNILKNDVAENWTDVGLMYLITNDIQLEFSSGYELSTSSENSHKYYQLLGLAFRI